jgi:3-oxoacyl-[acyl-carrier-protein] synthase II
MRRVVVTGMGTINPLANSVEEYGKKLCAGESGIDFIADLEEVDLPTKFGGKVKNFNPDEHMNPKDAKKMDCFTHYAIAAGFQALKQAGLHPDQNPKIDKERVGIIIGSGIGGIHEFTHNDLRFEKHGYKRVSPFFIPKLINDMASGYLSILTGFMGPNYSVSSACATSNHAISEAYNTIVRADADIMVTGGTEGALTPLGLAGFIVSRALSRYDGPPQKASRPFDKNRDGFVMSEGSGVLVLEELESAKKRGAQIFAEIFGAGTSNDAYHMTEPHPEGKGAILCMNTAIKNAKIDPTDVNYINCHATSTPVGDKAEIIAIKNVFGDHAKNIAINATKSIVGHLLGAAGGVELIATIYQMLNNTIHPSINIENLDPECEIENIVMNESIEFKINKAISNSFGFGGHNCALVVGRFED